MGRVVAVAVRHIGQWRFDSIPFVADATIVEPAFDSVIATTPGLMAGVVPPGQLPAPGTYRLVVRMSVAFDDPIAEPTLCRLAPACIIGRELWVLVGAGVDENIETEFEGLVSLEDPSSDPLLFQGSVELVGLEAATGELSGSVMAEYLGPPYVEPESEG